MRWWGGPVTVVFSVGSEPEVIRNEWLMSRYMRVSALILNNYIRYLAMNGYVTALAWLFAFGSFLLAYIRVIRSLYRTPLQDANDAVLGARHNFDILKPVIIFIVSMSWIVTHL